MPAEVSIILQTKLFNGQVKNNLSSLIKRPMADYARKLHLNASAGSTTARNPDQTETIRKKPKPSGENRNNPHQITTESNLQR